MDKTKLNKQLTSTLNSLAYEQGRMQEEMKAAGFDDEWIKWTIEGSEAGPKMVQKEVLELVPAGRMRTAVKRCINNIYNLSTKAEKITKELANSPLRVGLNG